jgi:hypothetical protein
MLSKVLIKYNLLTTDNDHRCLSFYTVKQKESQQDISYNNNEKKI